PPTPKGVFPKRFTCRRKDPKHWLSHVPAPGQIWLGDEASTTYICSTQIPHLAGDMYTLSSEVLMAQATKALVLDSGLGDGGRALETDSAMDALQVDLPKKAVEEYKKSLIFDMELYRMGWVSLEYAYQLALARLRAQHPGIEKKEDPLTLLLENVDVSMTKEQPFDDSPPSADR
ncbi:hypothetical protein B296_00024742, partial [Ensete ventricosum]